MGDPRKRRKKYSGPTHPWRRTRIESENKLQSTYGLKNKKEIWKASSELRRVNAQAKKLIRIRGIGQGVLEQKQLLDRLYKLALVEKEATLEDVLGLETINLLNRRLQTIVFKRGLALTAGQARQLIVHGHIMINGEKMTVPSYIVSRDEEMNITFNPLSTFANAEHPERSKEKNRKDKADEIAKTKKKAEELGKGEITEAELEKIEKEVGGVETVKA
mgnify:FL=1